MRRESNVFARKGVRLGKQYDACPTRLRAPVIVVLSGKPDHLDAVAISFGKESVQRRVSFCEELVRWFLERE